MSAAAPVATSSSSIAALPLLVRRAAVLGAGTMGSRIAAHLANAGIPTLLLDMVPAGEGVKTKLALLALDALAKTKPAAFYDASLAALITPGNFDEDLPKLAQCDVPRTRDKFHAGIASRQHDSKREPREIVARQEPLRGEVAIDVEFGQFAALRLVAQ